MDELEYNALISKMLDDASNKVLTTSQGCKQQWARELLGLGGRFPEELSHYTDVNGLNGIVKTKTIYATHYQYMNDYSELAYGIDILSRALREKRQSSGDSLASNVFNFLFGCRLNQDFSGIPVFVACFCRAKDLLSQWRGYADRGGGYAIEFLTRPGTAFESEWDESHPDWNVTFSRVEYSNEKQHQIITQVVESLWSAIDEVEHNYKADATTETLLASMDVYQQLIETISYDCQKLLLQILLCFKHPTFAEEQEWRIAIIGNGGLREQHIEFRTSNGSLIPYIILPLNLDSSPSRGGLTLNAVRFGPTRHPKLTKRALRMLLEKYGYGRNVNVAGSLIPLKP